MRDGGKGIRMRHERVRLPSLPGRALALHLSDLRLPLASQDPSHRANRGGALGYRVPACVPITAVCFWLPPGSATVCITMWYRR